MTTNNRWPSHDRKGVDYCYRNRAESVSLI